MEINKKIDASLESLNAYNKIYPWIPNDKQIRPTDMIITFKNILMEKIKTEYGKFINYCL